MTATTWASFILGGGGALTGFWAVITQVQDRRRNIAKAEAGLAIDEVTEKRILAEAAQINSDVAIAQQNWWRDSFDAVRGELAEEQKLRRYLTKWAKEHQEWDQRAFKLARQSDPNYPAPPVLENGL